MFQPKKNYQSHRTCSRNHICMEIQQGTYNKDRYYMLRMLRQCVEYLDQYHIYEYQNFSDEFKNAGFKTDNIKDYITEFKDFINSQSQNSKDKIPDLKWINKRSVTKANYVEKNIVLNRLAHEYSDRFLFFTRIFVQKHFQGTNYELFYREIKKKADHLHNIITNIQIE